MKFSLVTLIALLSIFKTIALIDNTNSILDYETNDIEQEVEWTTTSSTTKLASLNSNPKELNAVVHDQLQIELRKMKSSITDELMEELISYYGSKFSNNDVLKEEIDNLTRKIQVLTQNFNSLGNNYKSLSANHRNLVDVVRNNLIRIKKERRLATSRRNTNPNSNTRALNDKKAISLHDEIDVTATPVISTKTLQLIISNSVSSSINDQTSSNEYDGNNRIVRHDENKKNLLRNEKEIIIKDCQDLFERGFKLDGVYKVQSTKSNSTFDVYCEFENSIGWTLLQNRFDGKVDFYQNWKAYKNGFGNMQEKGEFWLGLEHIHILTINQNYSLQIVMSDWKNNVFTAEYESFKVNDEKSKYKLVVVNYLRNTSTAGDSFGDSLNSDQSHNNMSFSTYDQDNDMRFYDNCAMTYKSGWWFNACFQSNLNGIYYRYTESQMNTSSNQKQHHQHSRVRVPKEENSQLRFLRNGIHWNSIDFYKSLKTTKLRIRRK